MAASWGKWVVHEIKARLDVRIQLASHVEADKQPIASFLQADANGRGGRRCKADLALWRRRRRGAFGLPESIEQNGAGCTTASRVFPPAPVRMQRGWQGDTGLRPGQAESAANRRRLVRCDGVDVQVHLPQVGEARNSSALHALLML
ncbi:hypothetical protein HBI31_174140 [Parastagonospora nodorum]|nr:hypothetical protein HBI31_174140 [Parastagonospora nodorum]